MRWAILPAAAVALSLAGLLSACTQAQQQQFSAATENAVTAAQQAEARLAHDGQLFCAAATPSGPVVAGLVNATAAAVTPAAAPAIVLATGATKAFVDAACAIAGGIPVSPPAAPATAPQIAINPPPAARSG